MQKVKTISLCKSYDILTEQRAVQWNIWKEANMQDNTATWYENVRR